MLSATSRTNMITPSVIGQRSERCSNISEAPRVTRRAEEVAKPLMHFRPPPEHAAHQTPFLHCPKAGRALHRGYQPLGPPPEFPRAAAATAETCATLIPHRVQFDKRRPKSRS